MVLVTHLTDSMAEGGLGNACSGERTRADACLRSDRDQDDRNANVDTDVCLAPPPEQPSGTANASSPPQSFPVSSLGTKRKTADAVDNANDRGEEEETGGEVGGDHDDDDDVTKESGLEEEETKREGDPKSGAVEDSMDGDDDGLEEFFQIGGYDGVPPDDQPEVGRGMRQSRPRDRAGNDRVYRELLRKIRKSSLSLGPDGGVLRLKNEGLASTASPEDVDEIVAALSENKRVQVLYIQNFERGMQDEQLLNLMRGPLRLGRIWAVNVGENMEVCLNAWRAFARELCRTNVGYTYVSEHHIRKVRDLKEWMIFNLRMNRKHLENRGGRVMNRNKFTLQGVGNMWYNPRAERKKREMDTVADAYWLLDDLKRLETTVAYTEDRVADNEARGVQILEEGSPYFTALYGANATA